jgi:dTDP-4-dehydrorhamnose 3,5-epimerase-like enzyme
VLRKPVLLETEKPQLVVMTIACLHNFLRRSLDSTAIYTPSGIFNFEESGRVITGSWRAMSNENITSSFPKSKISVNHL